MLLFVVVFGVVVGITAVRWDRDGSSGNATTVGNVSTALEPSFAPPVVSPEDRLRYDMAQNEALTDAQFGAIVGSVVAYDQVARELAAHENAMTAAFGPATVSYTSPGMPELSLEEQIAQAIAQHDASFPPVTGQ